MKATGTIRLWALAALMVLEANVYGSPCRVALNPTFKQQNIPILLYHHVNVLPTYMSRTMRRWSLSPEKFRAQMDWVASHGFHTITMEQLVSHLKHGPALPHKQAWYEIVESKRILEKYLNKPITVLAYPYGRYNDDVMATARAAGFEGAVGVSGINNGYLYRADQSFSLERYAIEGSENLGYLAHLKGFDSK